MFGKKKEKQTHHDKTYKNDMQKKEIKQKKICLL